MAKNYAPNQKQEDEGWNNLEKFIMNLQLAFIILRLCDKILWNWLFVLSPAIISVLIAVIGGVISGYIEREKRKRLEGPKLDKDYLQQRLDQKISLQNKVQ